MKIKLLYIVLFMFTAISLCGCPLVRATGDTVEAVGDGAGHAVEETGDAVGRAGRELSR